MKLINYIPSSAVIETYRGCIFNCPYCPIGRKKELYKNGYMSFKTYKKVFRNLENWPREISLFNFGESFLNKDIFKIIRFTKKNGLTVYESLNVLLLLLKRGIANKIANSGIDYLILSMNSFNPKILKLLNGYPRNEEINIDELMELIKKMVLKLKESSPKSTVILQMLATSLNDKEVVKVDDIVSKARQLGVDMLTVKTLRIFDINDKWLLPSKKYFSRYATGENKIKPKYDFICTIPWRTIFVDWRGYVHPCWYDLKDLYVFGDLKKEKISRIWRNQSFTKFRRQILNNKSKIEMCRLCSPKRNMYVYKLPITKNGIRYIIKEASIHTFTNIR